MIKVYKSEKTPDRLSEVGYNCDEVKQAILIDQHDKCYLCERKVTTDYEVEHFFSIMQGINAEPLTFVGESSW